VTFIDETEVEFISGNGGSGAVSFHREKHVPRGGPNGADGGRGGSIILIADRYVRTLYDFRLHPHVSANSGVHAIGNKRGRDAEDVIIKVPIGTIVHDITLDEPLADMNAPGMKYIVCQGGRGGKGNLHYVNSVRQVPNFAQKGAPGETVRARLELKLLADVGLIGLPNAGKSTLLGRISAARPKIADYPFTTIVPNLGMVKTPTQDFVVADLPGLIEGASEGLGLGHQFLKHAERTRVLVHIVDLFPIEGTDPVSNYEMIEAELKSYQESLATRPRLIVLNKVDALPSGELAGFRERFEVFGHPVYPISAVTGEGVERLTYAMAEVVANAPVDEIPTVTIKPLMNRAEDDGFTVTKEGEAWEVHGRRVLRMVAMTDLANTDGVRYLHRRLNRLGVIEKLREAGAQEDDTVYIGKAVFSFTDDQ